MKKVFSILFILGFSPLALADVGLGMSAIAGDREIYVPININDRYRIEPSLQILHFESTDTRADDYSRIQIGAFRKKQFSDEVSLLVGARLGYSRMTDRGPDDRTVYSIMPTLGLEYALNDHLSVSGEVGINYYEESIKTFHGSDNGEPIYHDATHKVTLSETALILRYFL